jgi:prepilin-type N-terminal cleavage/methylation domain-containing protein
MKNKGFTLIELLVVISIISLLSTIVLASLNTAREKSKAAALVHNLKQLQLALELYKNDTGKYPYEDVAVGSLFMTTFSGQLDEATPNLESIPDQIPLIPNYIAAFPKPLSFNSPYQNHGADQIIYSPSENTGNQNSSYTCDGRQINEAKYAIYYLNDSYESGHLLDLPLPKYLYNGNPEFASGYYYCLLSN